MYDKAKRKHNSHSLFTLKFLLILFILGIWTATLEPIVWLAPPLFQFTPLVYIIVSLLWIPMVWRVRCFVRWDKVILILIMACVVSTHFMSFVFYKRVSRKLDCTYVSVEPSETVYRCITGEYMCPHMRFEALPIGHFLIIQDWHWYHSTACLVPAYFVNVAPLSFLCALGLGIYFVKKPRLAKLV